MFHPRISEGSFNYTQHDYIDSVSSGTSSRCSSKIVTFLSQFVDEVLGDFCHVLFIIYNTIFIRIPFIIVLKYQLQWDWSMKGTKYIKRLYIQTYYNLIILDMIHLLHCDTQTYLSKMELTFEMIHQTWNSKLQRKMITHAYPCR